jgi:hypothetical protein
MTVDAPEAPPPRRSRSRARRRPAPPAAPAWRWGFPVVLVVLAVTTLVLSANGARLVLDSRDGQVGRSEQDPTKPGYVETVAATPLLLVVHADDEDLYGAVVMALGADESGGSAVFISPDTIVRPKQTLADIYDENRVENPATGDGLRGAVSELFGADIDATVTVDATSLAPLIEPVAPLRWENAEPVRVTRNGKTTTVLAEGEVSVRTSDEIAAAIETLGNGEEPIGRLDRQIAFWNTWLSAVKSNPDGAFRTTGTDAGLPRFLRGLASGTPALIQLPTIPFGDALVANADALAEELPDIVPYPRQEGVRLNVAVRNGVTADVGLSQSMERRLVAAGAQIASRGNADAFGVTTTSVVYHDEAVAERARALAAAIGATDVRYEQKVDSEIQVTVTIGADFDPSKASSTSTPSAGTQSSTTPSTTGAPR